MHKSSATEAEKKNSASRFGISYFILNS